MLAACRHEAQIDTRRRGLNAESDIGGFACHMSDSFAS